jgi:hypothetical protein
MSEDYRRKETECRYWAKATDDVVLKMNLLEIADAWKIKADSVEKIKARRGTAAGFNRHLMWRTPSGSRKDHAGDAPPAFRR